MPSIVNRLLFSLSKRSRQHWVRWLGCAFFVYHYNAYSTPCTDYSTYSANFGNKHCGCGSAGAVAFSYAGSYAVNFNSSSGSKDGTTLATDSTNVGFCSSATDTTCNSTQPASLSTGDILYLKNTTETSDYYKCTVTLGQNMLAESYNPIVAPPPGSAPIFDLKPAEIFASEIEK